MHYLGIAERGHQPAEKGARGTDTEQVLASAGVRGTDTNLRSRERGPFVPAAIEKYRDAGPSENIIETHSLQRTSIPRRAVSKRPTGVTTEMTD